MSTNRMNADKAFEILFNYKVEHVKNMSPDERDAFDVALEELQGQASVDEEYERLKDLGHYDKGASVEMVPVEKIYEAIEAQAKQGSCKTCRWCVTLSAKCERQFGKGVRLCEIQSNVNPIDLSSKALDSTAYPGICDVGRGESDGDDIPYCLG